MLDGTNSEARRGLPGLAVFDGQPYQFDTILRIDDPNRIFVEGGPGAAILF
jgi:hypothetical protein